MKILVLGATGRTGAHLLDRAFAVGHAVRVLVRDPSMLGPVRDRAEVVQGDATDPGSLKAAVLGTEAVLVALGPGNNLRSDLASRSAQALVEAFPGGAVGRAILLSATGVSETLAMALAMAIGR